MAAGDHVLTRELFVPKPVDEVFAFFSDARNLARITPRELGLTIRTAGPITMAVGTLIDYDLRVFGLAASWRTRISAWEPGVRFVDEQLKGPYRRWVHTHDFRAADGGTLVTDHVAYRLPFFPFGEIALPIVRRQLKHIFDYRTERIAEIIGGRAA